MLRNSPWIASALLALMMVGAGAAQSTVTAEADAGTSDSYETYPAERPETARPTAEPRPTEQPQARPQRAPGDDRPEARPSDRPMERPFMVVLDPPGKRVEAGGSVTYTIVAHAKREMTLGLRVARISHDLEATLSTETLHLSAYSPVRARLTIQVAADAAPGAKPFLLQAVTHGNDHVLPIMGVAQVVGPRDGPTFKVNAEPSEQRAPPGGEARYVLHAVARGPKTLELAVRGLPDGYHAKIEPSVLHAGRDGGRAVLVVQAPRDAAPRIGFGVVATDASTGEEQGVRLALHRAPDRPKDTDATGVRMLLWPEHARVNSGGARVALLVQAGDQDVTLRLEPRVPADSGWRVHVEERELHLRANTRTYVWIGLAAGEAASETLEYAIVGTDGEHRYIARGVAVAPQAHIA